MNINIFYMIILNPIYRLIYYMSIINLTLLYFIKENMGQAHLCSAMELQDWGRHLSEGVQNLGKLCFTCLKLLLMFKVMNFFMKKGLKKTCMQDNLFSGSFYFLLMLVYLLNNVVACFVVSIYSEFVM